MGIFLGVFFVLSAYGAKVSYPEQKILARGVEKIQIVGVRGHVKLSGKSNRFYRLKVSHSRGRKFEDWSLLVDRRGKTLVFEVSSVAHGAQWRRLVRKEDWPEFDIELTGPAQEAAVSWRDGQIEFSNWSAAVESSQISGRVEVKNSIGNFRLDVANSDVFVANVVGDLLIKGEVGKIDVNGLKGNLDLKWVNGPVRLNGVQGVGRVEVAESRLSLHSCNGDWTLNVARGQADIERCTGKLQAEGQSTKWSLKTSNTLESEVRSKSGEVFVKWLSGGAKVFLTSNQGAIKGSLVKAHEDAQGRQVAEFKLNGTPKGQIFVRTETGAIEFKQ